MRKYYLILLAILVSGINTSCSLKEEPYGFYSDKNFFKTAAEAESALYYAYQILNYREYLHVMYFINDVATEEMNYSITGSFGVPELDFWNYPMLDNNEQLDFLFKYAYIGINRANSVIDNVLAGNLSQQVKDRVLGQAYFLRAFHYFYLARTFGVVPAQRSTVETAEQAFPDYFTNMDELYDFIIEDLTRAEQMLGINRRVGLADKVAAQSLLAQVYLTIASAKESNVEFYRDMNKEVTQMYKLASETAEKVLYNQNEYALDADLYNIYDFYKSDGPEHIFVLGFDQSGTEGWQYNILPSYFMPSNSNQLMYFRIPNGKIISNVDGYGAFNINDSFVDSFDPADKRRTDLLTKTFYMDAEGAKPKTHTYYLSLKYLSPERRGTRITGQKPTIIRFSDIALVYAEAQGPTTEAYTWLNRIRNRAGLPDAPAGMSLTDFRNYVVQERSYELAFEANRLFDLRRKARVTITDPYAMLSGVTEEQTAFYPIPAKELELNPRNN